MSKAEDAERARTRRRWVTLGEVLAVVAVAISGLTLWNSWSERADSRIEKASETARQAVVQHTLLLTATGDAKGGQLTLAPLRGDQSIQGQAIAFPTALGVKPVETTGDARIEAGWFDSALVKARRAAGLPAETRGDERIPVAIATRYLADGVPATDHAVYQLGYATQTGFLSGTDVRLRGLSLVARVKGDGQARVDALWRLKAR